MEKFGVWDKAEMPCGEDKKKKKVDPGNTVGFFHSNTSKPF